MTRLRMLLLTATLLAATLCHAQTVVSGEVTTTTWTKAAAPYTVTDSVTVPAGNTLTIEPGVEVIGDSAAVLVVRGALHVRGTEADSVRFLRGSATWPWRGIEMCGGDSSSLRYARIAGVVATRGGAITIRGAGTRAGIEHCVAEGTGTLYLDLVRPAGSGVVFADSATGWLSDCVIRGNQSSISGGGMAVYGAASVTARRTDFIGNFTSDYIEWHYKSVGGGGVYVTSDARLDADECTFESNTAHLSTGGGVLVTSGGVADLRHCRIAGNKTTLWGGGGGVSVTGGTLRLANCVVAGNHACELWTDAISGEVGGGAAYARSGATLEFTHCTIVDNTADLELYVSGIVAQDTVDFRMINSILWSGAPSSQRLIRLGGQWGSAESVSTAIEYSIVGGDSVWAGPGNLNVDPMLRDPSRNDFSLLPGSPAMDAGDPASPLDPDGTRADIGATGGGGPLPSQPRIAVSPSSLIIVESAAETLVVRNLGQADASVDLQLPTGFSTDSPTTALIAPDDSVRMAISFTADAAGDRAAEALVSHPYETQAPVAVHLLGLRGTRAPSVATGTWSRSNSPYRVLAPISVPAGAAWEVEAGVEILFDADVAVHVHGRVHVRGAEGDSVFFRPGTAGEWGGLRIDSPDSSSMLYAVLSDARTHGGAPDGNGGAVFVTDSLCRLRLEHATLRDNGAGDDGGAIYVEHGALETHCCTFRGNRAEGMGGAVAAWRGAFRSTESVFERNTAQWRGGAIYGTNSSLSFQRCVIASNVVDSGINVGERYGGGICTGWCDVVVENCTIADNQAPSWGGGIADDGSAYLIISSILWGSLPNNMGQRPSPSSSMSMTYSVTGNSVLPGKGNISADPLFTDPENGDYSLRQGSPCIDAGNPAITDPDGSQSDMGAIPYTGPVSVTDGRPVRFALGLNLPNPFNPVTTIPYVIAEAGLVTLSVYNLQGQLVRTLVQDVVQPGEHHAVWDGRDFAGRQAASGVYVYRLTAPEGALTRRMLLVR